MPIPENRDELKQDAEKIAADVGRAFADDWLENIGWVMFGLCVGYIRWATA